MIQDDDDDNDKFKFEYGSEHDSDYGTDEADGTAIGGNLYGSSGDLAMGMSKLSGSIADDREGYEEFDDYKQITRNSEKNFIRSNKLALRSEDNDHNVIRLHVDQNDLNTQVVPKQTDF